MCVGVCWNSDKGRRTDLEYQISSLRRSWLWLESEYSRHCSPQTLSSEFFSPRHDFPEDPSPRHVLLNTWSDYHFVSCISDPIRESSSLEITEGRSLRQQGRCLMCLVFLIVDVLGFKSIFCPVMLHKYSTCCFFASASALLTLS